MKSLMLFACALLLSSCSGKPLDQNLLSDVLDRDDVRVVLAATRGSYEKAFNTKHDGREASLDFMYTRDGKQPTKALGVSFARGRKRLKWFVESLVEGGITRRLPQVTIIDVQRVPALGEHAYAALINFGYGVMASVFFQKDDMGVLIELMPYQQRDRTPQHREELVRLAELVHSRI